MCRQAGADNEHQVDAATGRIVACWGRIDFWVNKAMATIFADAMSVDPADFRRATEVTYLGPCVGSRGCTTA